MITLIMITVIKITTVVVVVVVVVVKNNNALNYNLLNVVCMYICLLMKGSISFDPNNAIFTQNIHEGKGCVNRYI